MRWVESQITDTQKPFPSAAIFRRNVDLCRSSVPCGLSDLGLSSLRTETPALVGSTMGTPVFLKMTRAWNLFSQSSFPIFSFGSTLSRLQLFITGEEPTQPIPSDSSGTSALCLLTNWECGGFAFPFWIGRSFGEHSLQLDLSRLCGLLAYPPCLQVALSLDGILGDWCSWCWKLFFF